MRGKGGDAHVCGDAQRITPAYAGKSAEIGAGCDASADHPRLCGEKFRKIVDHTPIQGSPPPMRGKDPEQGSGHINL